MIDGPAAQRVTADSEHITADRVGQAFAALLPLAAHA
ncbi:hypothetical protein H4W34_001944 [Actinomadura algeriensis]|uniref:Uncharacterized protein n=1 Tax=Actinomadura algeriensis TaxID=1679523 RepID=A0ABR9JP26_9ACTN|nr:hypothetical protein [Actinomadura algeriensis]